MLALLLLRAYVPVGFMPASGAPFLLEICPAGFQAQMPAHHLHHHPASRFEFADCPFGSAPATGPISDYIVFEPPGQIVSRSPAAFEPLLAVERPERAHQARGPPTLA